MNRETRNGDWMQTFTGRKFYPLDPRPEEIDIFDIAHALAHQCRYNGHSDFFYSVAEHSVLVSRVVPPEHALWGLLHDAAEAYLGDMIRPLKRTPEMKPFHDAEERVMAAVCQRFGLTAPEPGEVKDIDLRICLTEGSEAMPRQPEPWNIPGPAVDVEIAGWMPPFAKKAFLDRFYELTRG